MMKGSNTEEGKFYHKNWYGEEAHQRNDNMIRLKNMADNYNFIDKTILDLGCNIGFFSFGLAQTIKNTIGIDYDKNAIDFANKMKKEHNAKNTKFIHSDITLEVLKKIGPVDCILGLAVYPWIMHQTSKDKMEKMLEWCSKNAQVNFIEIQYENEPGQLPGIKNDDDCKKYLQKYFKYVYKVCKINGWGPRTIWKCLNNEGDYQVIINTIKTKCSISTNGIFKKEIVDKRHTFENEVKYLKLLDNEPMFPKYICHDDKKLLMSGINGINLHYLIVKKKHAINIEKFKEMLYPFYNCLQKYNICHQDINLDNIVIAVTGAPYLVDFEYASELNGEIKNILKNTKEDINNFKMIEETLAEMKQLQEYFNLT